MGNPKQAPRSQAFQERAQSCALSHRRPLSFITEPGSLLRPCQARYIASPTAKSPTAATVTSIPSSNSGRPKVKRGCPVCRSTPTMPSSRPKASASMPRSSELPSTADTATSDSTMRLKYSAGPNFSAASTTQGAKKVRARVPMVPATKLPIAAVAKAWPARPFRAILLPSSAVTMLEVSPGVFNRMEVVEPP